MLEDLRFIQADTTKKLCKWFVRNYPSVLKKGKPQRGIASYYKRRYPKDSKLDIDRSIRDQFNLLRIVDNESYPAYFEMGGKLFSLNIKS